MNERHIFEIPSEASRCLAILIEEEVSCGVTVTLRPLCVKGELSNVQKAGILFAAFVQAARDIKDKAKTGCKTSKRWCKETGINPCDPSLAEIAGSMLFFDKLKGGGHD